MTNKELKVFNVNGIKVGYKIIHEQYYITGQGDIEVIWSH